MKSIRNLWVCTGLALMLSACATPYDTEKGFWSFDKGFETVQIAPDGWQISFVGNTNTDRALAQVHHAQVGRVVPTGRLPLLHLHP